MAETETETSEVLSWHFVGSIDELKNKACRKIYMEGGPNLALFYVEPGKFFLTNSSCPHAKGPLEQGSIEDLGGSYQLTCPMHYFTFDLETGESPMGPKLRTYQTEQREDGLYALIPRPVSLTR